MSSPLENALERLCEGKSLDTATMRDSVASIMRGECSEAVIAAFLTALRLKGESVSELVGAAQALQEYATPLSIRRTGTLDTCGTGGDQLHTFNISTAAAIVVAAAGVPVPKHGNRSVSSSSGSADVLEALGVNLQLTPEKVAACVEEIGIGFCFAPVFHGAMRHAAPVRKQLKFRTIFNLLGPLTNPARADYQLVGASRPETAAKLAQALATLGRRHALVVCGNGELDEVSLWGETTVFEVTGGEVREQVWTPDSFGLAPCAAADLRVASASESAEVIRAVLFGKEGPARNMILANAAAGLMAAERFADLPAAVACAAETIDSGAASRLLDALVRFTQQ